MGILVQTGIWLEGFVRYVFFFPESYHHDGGGQVQGVLSARLVVIPSLMVSPARYESVGT